MCCLCPRSEGPIIFVFYKGKTLFALLLHLMWNMKLLRIQNTLVSATQKTLLLHELTEKKEDLWIPHTKQPEFFKII